MRRCRFCKQHQIPKDAPKSAFTCSPECALAYVRKRTQSQNIAKDKAIRKEQREFKVKVRNNDIALQKKLTQSVFNRMVCLLDKVAQCISCARPANWDGQWQASHYRSVGAQGSLRFDPLNVHKACSVCNGPLSGNLRGYAEGLKHHYGQAILDYLEIDRSPVKWTCEELISMRKRYANEIRLLESGQSPTRNWRALS